MAMDVVMDFNRVGLVLSNAHIYLNAYHLTLTCRKQHAIV